MAHWEFAYGPAHLRSIAKSLRYPLLAINCYEKTSGQLAFPPSCVIERVELTIGVDGIAATIVDKSMPPAFSEGIKPLLMSHPAPNRTQEHARDGWLGAYERIGQFAGGELDFGARQIVVEVD